MASTPEKEFGSIQSTLETALSVYRDPVVAENMSSSDFKIADLMNHEKPVSLYLIVPPSDIDRMMPAFRVIVELLYRRNVEKMDFDLSAKNTKSNKHRLLMLLDEFPQLGKMETFETALGVIAGYGIKAFVICQSVMQINKLYGKDNGIISNCEVQIFYAPNDQETAEQLSNMLGKKTVQTKSRTTGATLISFDKSRTYDETDRDLMTPDEVRALDPKKELVFKRAMRPILANKLTWYDNPDFMNLPCEQPQEPDVIPHAAEAWYEDSETKLDVKNTHEQEAAAEKYGYAPGEENEDISELMMPDDED